MGIDLRAQIFIACRPAGRITLAHCLELLASFRFHILRQNLRSVDNTGRRCVNSVARTGQTVRVQKPHAASALRTKRPVSPTQTAKMTHEGVSERASRCRPPLKIPSACKLRRQRPPEHPLAYYETAAASSTYAAQEFHSDAG